MEKLSGKDFRRPRYLRLVKTLQPGDVLVVKSIDRLGRNYDEILEQWSVITKKRKAAIVAFALGGNAEPCPTILRSCGRHGGESK